MSEFLINIESYFATLATVEEVRAVTPKDFATNIGPRDGKLVGICNYYKLKRIDDINNGVL